MAFSRKEEIVVETYSALIGEAKARIDAINKALAGVYKLPNPLLREFCFLQFRMVCELIAHACITAHGDIVDAKLREQWSADVIMKRLSDLLPTFYPEPIVEKPAPWPLRAEFEPFKGDYLAKADLIALNGKCGAVLHQGSYRRFLTKKQPTKHSHPDIEKFVSKITNLLKFHAVSLIKPGKLYVCHYLASGHVQVFLAESIGDMFPATQNSGS